MPQMAAQFMAINLYVGKCKALADIEIIIANSYRQLLRSLRHPFPVITLTRF
jgi:hypothetical protein